MIVFLIPKRPRFATGTCTLTLCFISYFYLFFHVLNTIIILFNRNCLTLKQHIQHSSLFQ